MQVKGQFQIPVVYAGNFSLEDRMGPRASLDSLEKKENLPSA
jgi:hypothetical protein